ncbi:tRNA1(Val) (adenine(37)-N6)-methyltransferase [Pelagimonas varians]|uniref:N5-glutamine S-adenosyl-L-methionine-dependent methyltransferase n=1 Tax=Pelagimonas varians TaxID=696760 RepID=A0A238L1X2_9RHOB|nr:methyltransferase [Pelagimonas varians]PYG26887.1 tRNA1(Val) A37 N6-methylase TrmN6 [Pelagimonas varians]SMX48948.1 N5-glutamine S-adenosyl-L-methionine-dependent methyltransferase [Pelagimonas varians]
MRTEGFAAADLTEDDFLGGKVRIRQPIDGYRAGTDPVLLAASVEALAGQSVLELGCGAAPALCCLGVRLPGLVLHGLELQPGYASLGRENLERNGLQGTIWQGDIADPPAQMKAQNFDHVIVNPPYFEGGKRVGAEDNGREIALSGTTSLHTWVKTATKRLKPRGYVTFIQRAERLPELMSSMTQYVGSLELLPLLPRAGRPPRLILLRGRKDGRADFRFHSPQVIHEGASHTEDGKRYKAPFQAILGAGAALPFSA